MQICHYRNNHTIHIIMGLFFISCHKNSLYQKMLLTVCNKWDLWIYKPDIICKMNDIWQRWSECHATGVTVNWDDLILHLCDPCTCDLKMNVKILILYILLTTHAHSSPSAILFQVRIMAKTEPRCPGGILKCCKLMKSEHSVLCINIISIPYMVIRYSAQCLLPMPLDKHKCKILGAKVSHFY